MPRTYTSPQRDKVTAYGLDAIVERLALGETQTEIARELGVSVMTLNDTLHSDVVTSARVAEAQAASAELFELEAMRILETTYSRLDDGEAHPNAGALASIAKERSQALWRQASIRDRSRYPDSRTPTVNIDARRQTSSITIQGMPTRPQPGTGGVGGIIGPRGVEEARVLSSSGTRLSSGGTELNPIDEIPTRAAGKSPDSLVVTNIVSRMDNKDE